MGFYPKPDIKFRVQLRIAIAVSCQIWLPFLMTVPKIKDKNPNISYSFLINWEAMLQT